MTKLKGDGTNSFVSVGGCVFTTRQDKQQNGWAWLESCYTSFISFLLSFGNKVFHDMNLFLIIDEQRT